MINDAKMWSYSNDWRPFVEFNFEFIANTVRNENKTNNDQLESFRVPF